ncbi:MAG TPA: acyl-CoA dehydrogenase family protein, partial [Candidatus Nanopelagicales bacterium]|nr:acyl-CoA dehydrogenase family protein [Candidatus Nanopelagicales bacterium]
MALSVQPADRMLPTDEAEALLGLVREICDSALAPNVAAYERDGTFFRDELKVLGRSGLLSLPYPEELGGGGQPYEVYLQALEEIAGCWLSMAVSVSVHSLACFPVAEFGTDEQRRRWLPDMLGGELLGAYCLSEPQSGSDAAALQTRAVREGDDYVVTGTKAWITHGGVADFYNLMVRTSDDGARGISCLLADAETPGLSSAPPERKMGAKASRTAQVLLDGARVPSDRLIGQEGQGFRIALAALDAGRLGIAACAVGLAQAALDAATAYAKERRQFGRPIGEFQGLAFLLADMATSVSAARALYLEAARRKDRGLPFGVEAAKAKLFATDAAMRVTTDAVQVFGGYGYVEDFPVERYMREAKVLQIVEGTNQVQRMVIGRSLTG